MVYQKDNRIYVKKTTSGKPIFFKLGKNSGMERLVKGGMVRGRVITLPATSTRVFIPRPDTEGQGAKKSSKDIIGEIDKALSSWSISKPSNGNKRPIKGGFLNLF